MARVTGPSRTELDARGDEFAARVTRAIRTTLRTVAPTTHVVDDLTRIQTTWRSVVKNSLAPHLRKQWDAAVLGVRGQLERIAARERETLLAAGFEIPKVSNPLAETFMSEAANRLVAIGDIVWYTARGEMLTGLQLGEGVAELRERVKASANVSSKRAEVIARTEVNSAMNNGAYQQMQALDVPTVKEWIATNDSRTRESHEEVDGEEIAGDAKFMVGGFPMDHPHDLNGPPSETINCRCTLAWEIDDDDDYWDDVAYVASGDASFHLPGRHEQKAHGRRYKKPGDKSSGLRDNATSGKKSQAVSAKGQRVLDFINDETKQPLPRDEANGHTNAFANPNFSPGTDAKFQSVVTAEKAADAMHPGYIQSEAAKDWLPLKKVNPASLVQTQKWLRQVDLSQSVSPEEGDREAIVIYRAKDGTQYLTNGHHRVNLALAKGLDEIEVREATSTVDVPSVVSPRRKETPRNASAEAAALTAASAAFHLQGKHDQSEHGRDKPDKPKKLASKSGKKLKVTHGIVHKKHEPGTIIAVSGSDSKRVVWDGNKYLLQEKQADGGWATTNTAIKSKAYVEIGKFDDDWREPPAADIEEDDWVDLLMGESPSSPSTDLTKKAGKSSGATGTPLKITHGLVHSKYEPGTVIAENGAGDKRVVWDGTEYRLQRKTDDGSWTSEKSVKKSKAYVEINAYDSDWRVPASNDVVADADANDELEPPQPSSQPTSATPNVTPSVPENVAPVPAPNAVITKAIPTDDYVKTGKANRYKDPEGNEWLLESYSNPNAAKSDIFASQLYSTLGVKTAQTDLVKLDEKNFPKVAKRLGTRKFAVDGESDPDAIFNTVAFDEHLRTQLYDGFTVDLWLGNTHTAAFENLTVDKDNNLIRDTKNILGSGSALTDKITQSDIDKMTSASQGYTGNVINPQYKPAAYVGIPDEKIIEGARKIASLSPKQIDTLVDSIGFGPLTASSYKAKLKSRRQSLIDLLENEWGESITGAEVSPEPTAPVGPGQPDNSPSITEDNLGLLSMDGLTKVKPYKNGAIFKNASGTEWFVKPVPSASHMHNHQLAANLYLFADAKAETPIFVELDKEKLKTNIDTNIAVQTEYDSSSQSIIEVIKSNPQTQQQVYESFAIDAWLGNWDVVGLGYENLTVDKNGDVKRTNLSGSLLYRANGEPKGAAFGDTVTEIDSLRDPYKNPSSAKIFANLTDDDIRKGVAKIEKIKPETIDFLVDQSGVTGDDAKLLKQKLKARRQDLINKYGSNAPKPVQSDGPAASTQPTATNALGGTTKTYTGVQKSKVKSIFDKHGVKWFNKTDAIFDAAHEVSTTHPDLTMADALDIMDQSLKKKTGNPFRTKVEKWLKTKAGKNHALVKGGSASLGGTAPKVTAAPSTPSSPVSSSTNGYQNLSKPTASAMQSQMNSATPPPWTEAQASALRYYTGGAYSTINKCARGTAPCDPTTKETLENIKAAMKPSTRNVILYRATNLNSFGIATTSQLEALIGKTVSDNGVISTSITKIGWSGHVRLEIEAPKGSHMAWVQPISLHPSENEMILAPGTHYEVLTVKKVYTNGVHYTDVRLRVIPGSDTRSRELKEQQKELVPA